LKDRLTYHIPKQDDISNKKAKISKIKLIVCLAAFGSLLFGLWAYNAYNVLIDFKFEQISEIDLPVLTLCIPTFSTINKMQHVLIFDEFDLDNVTRPGDFNLRTNMIHHCSSTNNRRGVENDCSNFIEYDGACLHIGITKSFPWSLKTGGRTLLSIRLVYQSNLQFLRHLVIPFFGWNTTCNANGQTIDGSQCTMIDDQHFGINNLEVKNPFVLYQLAPNQMLLADIKKENHITSHGVKSTIYPTNFIGFPFNPLVEFGDNCNELSPSVEPCQVIYFGLRSLSKTVQTTREENYLSRVIRTVAVATSQISLITTVAGVLFGYFITRLYFTQRSAYIDHDLREPILFLVKCNQSESK
jgi:hypothetical protein